ncbi:probable DEAD-box ATP-dependent RNA helicase 48 [Selaginella moellendorffii]|uniref:probable DEAD-box ATP-dependent RNA helicase 48 n=1 Tax=Selaginella moellendorffii TaxID=88036 RepID=UPI000D1C3E4A|nr:probable DEAD-box ATP-dependent RNA helicase 48 [Selaginella moellendorffii]|eukprot:XP_024537140.1 probable DEAD-box ATP-dependent RNA helicase 48 [Selaginella moellendorffii]
MAMSLSAGCGNRWELLVVRMGGGKRTFPGGVTKWQWKRLQMHKQRMREKAWLLRERRIYEKRKRQEMMAAVTVLEKPWEQQSFPARTPMADEQLSALADRFRKPGALDLWNWRDGPSRNAAAGDGDLGEQEEGFFSVDNGDDRPFLPVSITEIGSPPTKEDQNLWDSGRDKPRRPALGKSIRPVLPEKWERSRSKQEL